MSSHAGSVPPPAFVRLLNCCLRKLGYFVADHDKLVLFFTLLLSLVLSAKIAFTPQEDDIKTGYTPFGARARDEMATYNEYFAAHGDPITVILFVVAKDGGNMARKDHMKEVVDLMDYTGANLTHKGHSFYSLCTDFCQVNEPVRQFYNGLVMHRSSDSPDEDRITLKFPLMEVLGKELDLSPNLFGVQTNLTDNDIQFVKIVVLQFRANPPKDWEHEDIQAYERMLSTYFHKHFHSDLIEAYGLSLTYTADEIVRTGLTIFPFISVGFAIMSVFSVFTVYCSSRQMGQWTNHKITQSVFGCICPLLATSSALGLLFWCGFRFGTILCVTPFLVLAIGVDDAYLMMHSWMRISNENPALTKRERVVNMLIDIGPSISITSLTNCLAFIVGIYTPTPEISLFCAGNAVAIFFDFLYQITMYAALISITGDMEMRKENQKKIDIKTEQLNQKMLQWLDDYSQWLASKFTAIALFGGLCAYWYITIHGALDITIFLAPQKLVIEDSPLIKIFHLRDSYVLQNYSTVNVFVENVGDLSNTSQLARINALMDSYESYPECLGAKFSHYFARDYSSYMNMMAEMEEEEAEHQQITNKTSINPYSEESMKSFLNWPEFKHWNAFIKFDEVGRINKIWATISYHGDTLGDFLQRKYMLKRWRDTADSFPDLKVSIFDDYAMFSDQLDTILPATISTSLCTLGCMMIVCFLYMQNLFVVIVATISITSICIGVFGFLSLWNVDLDPISMATTIMSIGFSVDFPAHITFHYFREGLEDPEAPPAKRVARSLLAIGFPLLQCGLSTILFVLCLLFVKTYMSEVFVKTMVLVVLLGLVHGLILVPAFLCSLTSIYGCLFKPKSGDKQSFSSFARLFHWKISPSPSEGHLSTNKISTQGSTIIVVP